MDAPHRYEMSLKKDGLFINLSSDDVYFVSKQMDKWFRILLDDSYVPVSLPKPAAVAPPLPVQPPSEPVASEIVPAAPPPEPVLASPPKETSVPVAPSPEPELAPVPAVSVPEAPVLPSSTSVSEPSVPEPSAPAMAAPIQTPPEPVAPLSPPVESPALIAAALAVAPSDVSAPPALSVVPPTVTVQPDSTTPPDITPPKDDFESVMDTVMRDLEAPPPPLPTAPVIETLYEQSPVSAAQPMNLDLVNSLADLCDQAHPGSSEDYLLLAAYYLSQVEAQACFSLKRINANLVKSGLTPVNHSALETALSRGHLSMVPDLSGTAEVSEYSLTDDGLAFVNQLF
ncbi:hypothetical protein [Vampirovibrio chlorellavorus]|uniref:hypothetical protein n=1 Tax=Vampirovibrio chlorellavorus TaxID=758823 RepID=UPI0026F1001E|nr:hypothetical protein [Vampirovibrio chlorellavorus]